MACCLTTSTSNNIDISSYVFCGIHMRLILHHVFMNLICDICREVTLWKSLTTSPRGQSVNHQFICWLGSVPCVSAAVLAYNGVKTSWWRHQMETFSALLDICAGNSPVPREFSAQMPVTRSFDVFFDLRLNKRLSKQWWGWWFETPSHLLWRHRNDQFAWHWHHKHAWLFESRYGYLKFVLVYRTPFFKSPTRSCEISQHVKYQYKWMRKQFYNSEQSHLARIRQPWAYYRIQIIAGSAWAGNAGNVFPATDFKGNR